jgi:hypothetical protein
MRLFGDEPFVNYIRLARVSAGVAYYVVPTYQNGCAPDSLQRTPFDGAGIYTPQGGGGIESAARIEAGLSPGAGPPGSSISSTLSMLIPDGVASVTIHYPAEPPNGFTHKIAPAYTRTFTVVGNVLVALVPRAAYSAIGTPGTLVYRASNGSTLKTVHLHRSLGPATY